MIFNKSRFEIWGIQQHPLKHNLTDFAYNNAALPGVSNVESAINYIVSVLYPQTKPNVPTPQDLPIQGSEINDYRIVNDDGDGRSAGYRFEHREGDGAPTWHKVFDVDWSLDAILASAQHISDDRYIFQRGKSDKDSQGAEVAGLYAGQTLFGGDKPDQNLTLNANSADADGPQTGYVQIDSTFRPAKDNEFDLSLPTFRWKDAYFRGSLDIDGLVLSGGSIVNDSGFINFAGTDLRTDGNVLASSILANLVEVSTEDGESVIIQPGVYNDSSEVIDFINSELRTTGQGLFSSIHLSGLHQITSENGEISFLDENLRTTGSVSAESLNSSGVVSGVSLSVGPLNFLQPRLNITGNTISQALRTANLVLRAPDGQTVNVEPSLSTRLLLTDRLSIGQMVIEEGRIFINGPNQNLELFSSNGDLIAGSDLVPMDGDTLDLGSNASKFRNLYLSGTIFDDDGPLSFALLKEFTGQRADGSEPIDGDSLIRQNGQWVSQDPGNAVPHNEIQGVTDGDAGHTQFALLEGRENGQTLRGGNQAQENLTLGSTQSDQKGSIFIEDPLLPLINSAISSEGYQGIDLGAHNRTFRDIYSKGEFKGFRLETVNPLEFAPSEMDQGRLAYDAENKRVLLNAGNEVKPVGVPTGDEQGQILSSQGDGNLRWEFPHRQVNGFINSEFQVHQRWSEEQVDGGVDSIGSPSSGSFLFDRWKMFISAPGLNARRAINSNGNNAIRIHTIANRNRLAIENFQYVMEKKDAVFYAGKTITISIIIRTNKNGLINFEVHSGAERIIVERPEITADEVGQEVVKSITFQVPQNIGSLGNNDVGLTIIFQFNDGLVDDLLNLNAFSDYIEFSEPMLNEGPVALPYSPRFSSYAEELRACQRYYEQGEIQIWENTNSGRFTRQHFYEVSKRVPPRLSGQLIDTRRSVFSHLTANLPVFLSDSAGHNFYGLESTRNTNFRWYFNSRGGNTFGHFRWQADAEL